jgi:hypothetical protein
MKCLGGEMVDTWNSKSYVTKRGDLSAFWSILLSMVGQVIIPSRKWNGKRFFSKKTL